jgi:hypothetical protein
LQLTAVAGHFLHPAELLRAPQELQVKLTVGWLVIDVDTFSAILAGKGTCALRDSGFLLPV